MPNCEYCGAELVGRTKRARLCSDKHRVYAKRRELREDRQKLTPEGAALLQSLRAVLPGTAGRVERFIEVNGVECTEAAIKLCLGAIAEVENGRHVEASTVRAGAGAGRAARA